MESAALTPRRERESGWFLAPLWMLPSSGMDWWMKPVRSKEGLEKARHSTTAGMITASGRIVNGKVRAVS